MIRAFMGACAVLAVLCAFQWMTLSRLKTDLATADTRAYRAALVELQDRREEFTRVLNWLDTYVRSAPGLGRSAGLCPDGKPDAQAIGDWVFDVYLRERASGASETEARQRVVDAIRQGAAGPR